MSALNTIKLAANQRFQLFGDNCCVSYGQIDYIAVDVILTRVGKIGYKRFVRHT
ncbi:MAG: hypothetical protein K2H64_11060 [Desulfovibrio sp.]|nr:hypothetical protein [Desulfovibrio sp.]